mmetsp:Transcript_25557/g.22706  ORF Transcript_25557/g.22706 Transcript_25557/m.22706 type:complete len:84 (+) Transcript_25557:311-562(+)
MVKQEIGRLREIYRKLDCLNKSKEDFSMISINHQEHHLQKHQIDTSAIYSNLQPDSQYRNQALSEDSFNLDNIPDEGRQKYKN